eukprot:CAMPEP_0181332568 /NCGR_PEP_ID=MMETSP1101-20121128/25173_1 /TAXON_ID=46948 /ORGANISM="Rhodomonas abbreviata, Strain Caron Lab Isolate" /LENGTH=239 /DNA_ID=CAMNT_0023442241 /DNA_START=128 /DNA_END=844 /DNA_ORIENTATION=-
MGLDFAPCDTREEEAPTSFSPPASLCSLPSDLIIRCFKGRMLAARHASKILRRIMDRELCVDIKFLGGLPKQDNEERMAFYGQIKVRKLTVQGQGGRFRALSDTDMSVLCAWLCNSLANSLESLESTKCVDSSGALLLAETLKSCQNLRFLDLSCNRMGDSGVREISQALQHILSLEDVNLQRNYIGNAELSFLLPLLEGDRKLTCLKLQGNPIRAAGHQMLEECGVQNMKRVYEMLGS